MITYRRTSWDDSHSDLSRDSRGYPFDPFADSRAPSHASSDDENVNTQTVSEKYNIMPTEGLLLFPEDVEKDDDLHNPDPADRERDCDICNTRGLVNVGGLALLVTGIVALFIIYPVTCVLFTYTDFNRMDTDIVAGHLWTASSKALETHARWTQCVFQ